MIIKKVELIDKGNKGIKVTFSGHRKINDQVSAARENDLKEKFPLPLPIRHKFLRLKYFFLTMTGVWRDDQWTEYLLDDYSGFHSIDDIIERMSEDQDITELFKNSISAKIMSADTAFSNTDIDGYEINGTKIKLFGTYEAIENKVIKYNLPFIDEDDDYALHSELTELLKEISTEIFQYLKEDQLPIGDVKELLKLYLKKDEDMERVQEQTEEENLEELMMRLEQNGAVVMPLAGGKLEKQLNENNGADKAEVASSGTVNAENFDNTEEHKGDDLNQGKGDETPENEKNYQDQENSPDKKESDDLANFDTEKKGDKDKDFF
jgi:hypothetical protein